MNSDSGSTSNSTSSSCDGRGGRETVERLGYSATSLSLSKPGRARELLCKAVRTQNFRGSLSPWQSPKQCRQLLPATPTPAEIWRRASTYLWEMPTPEEEGDADGHLPIGGDGDAQKKESERRQQHIYARRNMEAGIYLPTGNDYARRGRRR